MTVIAYKAGYMAADTCSFSGGIRYRAMHPKISKGTLGLFGAAGRGSDCVLAHEWFLRGMQEVARPQFSEDKDEPLAVIWVRPNGTVWWGDHRLSWSQVPEPSVIGTGDAATFTEGAMHAGLSAADAVALAIKHCVWVGGGVQVEHLRRMPKVKAAKGVRFLGLSELRNPTGIRLT